MDTVPLYQEHQVSPIRTPLAIVDFLAISLIPVFIKIPVWMILMFISIAALSAGMIYTFFSMKTLVYPDKLKFGFALFNRTLPIAGLQVGDIVPIPFSAGIGIHYYRRVWFFNARFGRGVSVASGKKKFVIGSDNPEMLQSALLQITPRKLQVAA